MKRVLVVIIAIGFYWINAFCNAQADIVTPVTTEVEFRDALAAAASNNDHDVIQVAAGTYTFSPAVVLVYTGAENFTLTITGAGSDATILNGNNAIQVLWIDTTGVGLDDTAHVFIEGLTFRSGTTTNWGSGLYVTTADAHITVSKCSFESNVTTASGGGTFLSATGDGSVTLTNNSFYGNMAGARGGGSNIIGMSGNFVAYIINNTFSNNMTDGNPNDYGGGVYLEMWDAAATAYIYNNIIWDNSAGSFLDHGNDVFIDNSTSATVNLFNNNLGLNADLAVDGGQSEDLWVTDNDNLGGIYNSSDNMQRRPDFVDEANGDLHLQNGSPCIDAGDDSAPSLPTDDIDGDARIIGSAVDIGADETQPAQRSSSGCFITSSQL